MFFIVVLLSFLFFIPLAEAIESVFSTPSTVTIKEITIQIPAQPIDGGDGGRGNLKFYFYTDAEYKKGFLNIVIYLKNEGIYIDDEIEINLDLYPFAGFFEKFFTAIPKAGEMTKINIRKKIDLTDGNYVLKTELAYIGDKANRYNKTSETVFTMKRELGTILEISDGKTLITEIIDFIKSIIQKIYNFFSFI